MLITGLALLPWTIVCMQGSRGGVIANYHLNNDASILSFLKYIFSASYFSYILLIVFIITLIIFIKNFSRSNNINCLIWVISGIVAVFGTFIIALLFSYLFFPIIDKSTLRYFLPAIVILWLLFAVFIQYNPNKHLYALIVILLIVFPGQLKLYLTTYKEFKADTLHEQTIQILVNSLDLNSYIITDQLHMSIKPIPYGYFGIEKEDIFYIEDIKTNSIPLINNSLLIFKEQINKNVINFIEKNGYSLFTVKENGLIGNIPVNIYVIKKDER